MKVSFIKSRIVPIGTALICVLTLFAYQNCAKDVGFDARPSTDRDDTPFSGNGVSDPNGPISGGDSNVNININEYPRDTTKDNGDSVIDFEVTAPNGNITDVDCTLDGVVVSCDPVTRIPITNLNVGEHVFVITGTDNSGNSASETITWVIYDGIVEVTTDIAVTTVGDKVDIIINVDNSGSMEYEHQSMRSRIGSFMAKFKDLDYNISITTTSPIGGVWHSGLDYVDGKFIQFADGSYCIRKNVNDANAQNFIEDNVVRDGMVTDANGTYPEGNGWERGIFTTYRAFERANNNGSNESGCLRDNVPKHVILISDETETVTDNSGNPLTDQLAKSNGTNLINYVATVFPNSPFKFHSIIVDPYSSEGAACLASHGRRSGLAYADLSIATGGVIGSVCAADYASQLGAIGQTISDSHLSYTLACVAVSNNGDNGSVTNLSNNQAVSGFGFNGDKVEFDQLLPAGNYRVRYFCYQ